ncbi:MAG: hypothetical protein AAFV31_10330 [Pseudomonadota bacterium]
MAAFALDLAPDGIRFLSREGDAWTTLEAARLEDADLPDRMAAMRTKAVALAGEQFQTALIIPASVILYTTVDAPKGTATQADVAAALEGLTPCPVDEMVFDWRQTGSRIQVAALDINTLDEAEEFAVAHGLNPCGFTARPTAEQFPAAPDFGPTQFARSQIEVAAEPEPAPLVAPEPAPVAVEATAPVDLSAQPQAIARDPAPASTVVLAALSTHRGPLLAGAGVLGSAAILLWSAFALMSPDQTDPVSPVVTLGTPDLPTTPALGPLATRIPDAAQTTRLSLPSPEPAAARRSTIAIAVPDPGATPAPNPDAQDLAEGLSAPNALRDAPPPLAAVPTLPPLDATPRREARLFAPDAASFSSKAELPPPIEFVAVDATSIWQTPPPAAPAPPDATTDDLYLASIDPNVEIGDAFALTPIDRDLAVSGRPGLLPGPGQIFDIDDRGLVRATPGGAVSPQGVVVTDGQPEIVPPQRPASAVPDTTDAIALALAGPRPRGRPETLIENSERARLGGRTSEELAGLRPNDRPQSAQDAALAAAPLSAPSAQAIAASPVPSSRPTDFDSRVASIRNRAVEQQAAQVAAAAATAAANQVATAAAVAPAQPSIPTTASVARQATIENALNLRRVNLIGVYGSDSDRRALIRLSSGRYVKVRVGDRVDGGQVAAIGDQELRLIKGGRDVTLTVPQG